MAAVILAASTVLQFVAAFLALRLVAITKHRTAWLLIAAAVLLMAVRRSITLYALLLGQAAQPPDLAAESVALVISVLMVAGVWRIAPVFLELRLFAETAAKNQQQLQAILDHTTTAVYVKDRQGRYQLINNTGARLMGRPVKDILGLTDADLLPTHVASQFRANDTRVIETRTSLELDENAITPDGTHHHYLSVKFPLLDPDGQAYAVCGISTDVTERVKAQEERQAFASRLLHAQKLESLGVLAGGVAHDFNNLLMVILGNAELAMGHPQVHAETRSDLQVIQQAAHSAAALCRQLLAYSGRGQLQMAAVNVSEVAQQMAQLMAVSVSKKAHLECQLASDLPLIKGDPEQVQQVIMNLLSNASDAIGDRPGSIRLSTSRVALGPQGLKQQQFGDPLASGDYVCVEVADTGDGMTEEIRQRMFEPFYTTRFTGRGLGLSAVAGIVRGHHAGVGVVSAVGEGTTVQVLFPAPDPPLESLHAKAQQSGAPSVGSGTILVVDDEPLVRSVAQRALERCGHVVLTAENGVEAIRVFQAHKAEIVLVLMDLTMPEMDGQQALAELQKMDPSVRVVLASGYDEGSARRSIAASAGLVFLQKPYSVKQLTEMVRSALG